MPIVRNGVFARIVFKVKNNAPDGTYYVSNKQDGSFAGTLDDKLVQINPKFNDGYVKIRK